MFTWPTPARPVVMKTWNVWVGCRFECSYCSARRLVETRLKNSLRYAGGFGDAHLVGSELGHVARFKPGDVVFIGYMGDVAFMRSWEAAEILTGVRRQPEVTFLFCTKDPRCYLRWQVRLKELWPVVFPPNLVLGTTIESDIDHGVSKAPAPILRCEAMAQLEHRRKFVSVEPVMKMNPQRLAGWIKEIRPEVVEVGADNYHCGLQEPDGRRLEAFLDELRTFCPNVIEKPGLERLKEPKRD